MLRQDWLRARKRGIGSSDAAAVCGLSKWRTALHVYQDKLGLLEDEPDRNELYMGRVMEPVIARLYCQREECRLRKPQPIIWHSDLSYLFTSIDYERVDDLRIVECKNVGYLKEWGEPGTASVPADYFIQAQHSMEASDRARVDIAALASGRDLYIYVIHRDYAVGAMLIEIESAFWERVQKRRPPPADWAHKATPNLIKSLFTTVEKRTVVLSKEESLHALVLQKRLQEASKTKSDAEKEYKAAQAEMFGIMGAAERAELADGSVWHRSVIERDGYTVQPSSYTKLTVREPKPKEKR